MKKGSVLLGSMIAGHTMYGAWCMYKQICPECAEDIKDDMEHMIKEKTKKVDKFVENVM